MNNIVNPYKPETLIYRLMKGDWSNMDMKQISNELGTTYKYIQQLKKQIEDDTGYTLQCKDGRVDMWKRGRKHKNS